jgi:hypothetical protein
VTPDAPETPQQLQRRQRTAWNTVAKAGGLVGRGDLERRWGVSRKRIQQITAGEAFPKPVGEINGQPVWLSTEADVYREQHPAGRPRKTPPPDAGTEPSHEQGKDQTEAISIERVASMEGIVSRVDPPLRSPSQSLPKGQDRDSGATS